MRKERKVTKRRVRAIEARRNSKDEILTGILKKYARAMYDSCTVPLFKRDVEEQHS